MNATSASQPQRNDGLEPACGGANKWPRRQIAWLVAGAALAAPVAGGWWVFHLQPEDVRKEYQPAASETPPPRIPPPTDPAQGLAPEIRAKPQLRPVPQLVPALAGDSDSRGASAPAATVPPDADAAIAEAQRIASRLVADFPRNPDALEVAARAQLVLGNTAEAVKAWQNCLALNPGYAYAYAGLGTVAARKGELEQAVAQFRRALEIDPTAVQTRLDLAQALFDQGEMDDAARELEDQLRRPGTPAEVHVLLGMISLQQGDAAKARDQYAAAVRSQPDHAAAQLGLANAYNRLGQTELAREATAEFHRLRAYERQIRQSDLRGYDDATALGEELARVCMNASRIYHSQGQASEAERLWRYAAAIDSANADSRQALAWMHRQRGQPQAAIQYLEELTKIEPAQPSYPLEVGRLYAELGERSAAETVLREACKRDPRLAAGHAMLARLYLEEPEQGPAALNHARTAVELQPTAVHFALLGAACQMNGDRQGAAAAWKEASELAPGNSEYRRLYETLSQEK